MPDSMLYLGIATIIIGGVEFFLTELVIKMQNSLNVKWSYPEEQRRRMLKIGGLPLMLIGILIVYLYFFG